MLEHFAHESVSLSPSDPMRHQPDKTPCQPPLPPPLITLSLPCLYHPSPPPSADTIRSVPNPAPTCAPTTPAPTLGNVASNPHAALLLVTTASIASTTTTTATTNITTSAFTAVVAADENAPDAPKTTNTFAITSRTSRNVDCVPTCPHCSHTFTSHTGLVSHLRIHRTMTGELVSDVGIHSSIDTLSIPCTSTNPNPVMPPSPSAPTTSNSTIVTTAKTDSAASRPVLPTLSPHIPLTHRPGRSLESSSPLTFPPAHAPRIEATEISQHRHLLRMWGLWVSTPSPNRFSAASVI
nr:unnamed protein product [Spirometra erinaceieuropaei]